MAKPSYECAFCYTKFDNTFDHISHATTQHVGEKVHRGWSCWRCAHENRYETAVCKCGFNNPYTERGTK